MRPGSAHSVMTVEVLVVGEVTQQDHIVGSMAGAAC